MARQRRGRGGPPELRGTLGTLLRTTLQQASAVRDAITSTARARIDDVRNTRRRQDDLAELGEIVLELIQRGEIDLDELPEARALVEHLLDDDHHDDRREPEIATPPTRSRFDDRRSSRPTTPDRPRANVAAPASDGTVSSTRWAAAARPAAPARVWRPPVADEAPPPATPPATVAPGLRKGGISFDDDDLAEYMHPDDVPPKDDKA